MINNKLSVSAVFCLTCFTCAPVMINIERDTFNCKEPVALDILTSGYVYPSNALFEISDKSSDGTKYYSQIQICFGECFKNHRCINGISLVLTSSDKKLKTITEKQSVPIPELVSLCVPVLTDAQYGEVLSKVFLLFKANGSENILSIFRDSKFFQVMAEEFRSMDPSYVNPNTPFNH